VESYPRMASDLHQVGEALPTESSTTLPLSPKPDRVLDQLRHRVFRDHLGEYKSILLTVHIET
jgi:hypothetical protein